MCKFTCLVYNCGHRGLSTIPEHTLLCRAGRKFIRQGIERAPAKCHPLSKGTLVHPDDKVDSKIAQTIDILAFCDECKINPDRAPDVRQLESPSPGIRELESPGIREVESPSIRDIASRVIPPQELGSYSESDALEVDSLCTLWLSCTKQCGLAIQNFKEELGMYLEDMQAKITLTLSKIMDTQLLSSDAPIHDRVLANSIQEANFLITVLRDYTTTRVPRSMFSELLALIRNKYYHTDDRREIFCELVDYIKRYNVDPSSYQLAIENITTQLARSLGRGYELDACEEAHLKTRDWDDERTSTLSGCCYAPRPSFTAGKKRKTLHDAPKTSLRAENGSWPLRIDTDKARNLPLDTEDIQEKHRNPEIVYIKGLATRTTLRPLDIGQGPWGIRGVLSDDDSAKLLARLERENEQLRNENRTVADNATFMNQTLYDSDDDEGEEKSDVVDETGKKVDETGEDVKQAGEEVDRTEEEADKTVEEADKTGEEADKTGEEIDKIGEEIDKIGEEADDQHESVLLSDEQISPRKRSQEGGLRKRPRLE